MDINAILSVLTIIVFAVILFIMYDKAKKTTVSVEEEKFNTIEKVVEAVKAEMIEIVRDDYTLGLSDEEFEKLYRRKARINEALKNCVYGIDNAKIQVIDLIRSFIAEKVPLDNINLILGLTEDTEPSSHVKFEILMYKYKKIYGKDALVKWIDKYGLANEKVATGSTSNSDKAYYITEEELDKTYEAENIHLNNEERIDILSILVYQIYKGFGIVDTLREMNINGFNMGTSGSILTAGNTNKGTQADYRANNAVWLYDRGKYIHLRFMNYGSEEELRRIIQMIIRYGNPGPLTAKRGYLVNTMYDKSRVLALRPPASEYWAVFVRKFTLPDISPEALIIKEYTNRGDLAIRLIEFLMRGQVTCAVTGRQGSGKTTLMSAIIRYIDPRYTIRVLELAPELYLRELYPTRNILSVQETSTVTASELQDALKKSDAAVSIVGEVATDIIAARMIQMGMVASMFTIFSHHANQSKDLVLALRNSLVNAGGFSNMETAEKQVTDVVKVDIHLDYTAEGKRYIARVTEIVQLEEGIPYPELDESDPNSINKLTAEYYRRKTDRIGFYTHDILRYNLDTDTYEVADRLSPQLEARMLANMGKERRDEFRLFMLKDWGKRDDEDFDLNEEISRLEKIVDVSEKDAVKSKSTVVNDSDADLINELNEWNRIIALESANRADAYSNREQAEKSKDTDEINGLGTFFSDEDYN